MLGVLTNDELARYGEIARDQASLELRRWWLHALLALAAIAVLGWAGMMWVSAGLGWTGLKSSVLLAIGLAIVLGYAPYRRIKNWVLWNQHCRAVRDEQVRRDELGRAGQWGA